MPWTYMVKIFLEMFFFKFSIYFGSSVFIISKLDLLITLVSFVTFKHLQILNVQSWNFYQYFFLRCTNDKIWERKLIKRVKVLMISAYAHHMRMRIFPCSTDQKYSAWLLIKIVQRQMNSHFIMISCNLKLRHATRR